LNIAVRHQEKGADIVCLHLLSFIDQNFGFSVQFGGIGELSVGHGGGVGEFSLLFRFLAVNSSPLCGSSPMMLPFGSLGFEGLLSLVVDDGAGFIAIGLHKGSSGFLLQSTDGLNAVGLHDGSFGFAVQSTPVGPWVSGAQLPLRSKAVLAGHIFVVVVGCCLSIFSRGLQLLGGLVLSHVVQ
jgi:hypothetical protein